jgi:hypothetical protein
MKANTSSAMKPNSFRPIPERDVPEFHSSQKPVNVPSVPRLSEAHFCLLQKDCCRSSGPIAK